jgi:hypothetical protein
VPDYVCYKPIRYLLYVCEDSREFTGISEVHAKSFSGSFFSRDNGKHCNLSTVL